MNVQHEYTQGVCEDGAAILCDGRPMPIEQIIIALRLKDAIQIKNDNLNFCLDKEIARIQDMWKDIERLKALAGMEKIAATAAIKERDELLNDMKRIANPVKFFHIEHPEEAQKTSAMDIIFRFGGAGYAVDIANKAIAKAGMK